MNFKKYMEFRADQDCPIGVVAFDLHNYPEFPLDGDEEIVLEMVDDMFKGTDINDNWERLKCDYFSQKKSK